jgi:hypothetical protein
MTNNTANYKPVWCCIYCSNGVINEATKRLLGKEHIIAFGLGGNLVLPRASCQNCGRITGMVEEKCQHMILGQTRIRLGLPTRHPNDRPSQLALVFRHADGRLEQKKVHPSDFPLIIPGLRLPPPGILTGENPHDRRAMDAWVGFQNEEIRKKLVDGGPSLRLVTLDNHMFSRMIAKIAHSYAVAELGIHSFQPVLLDLILDKSQTPFYWIGGDMTVSRPKQPYYTNYTLRSKQYMELNMWLPI